MNTVMEVTKKPMYINWSVHHNGSYWQGYQDYKIVPGCLNIHSEFDVICYMYTSWSWEIEEDVNLVFIEIKPQKEEKAWTYIEQTVYIQE